MRLSAFNINGMFLITYRKAYILGYFCFLFFYFIKIKVYIQEHDRNEAVFM